MLFHRITQHFSPCSSYATRSKDSPRTDIICQLMNLHELWMMYFCGTVVGRQSHCPPYHNRVDGCRCTRPYSWWILFWCVTVCEEVFSNSRTEHNFVSAIIWLCDYNVQTMLHRGYGNCSHLSFAWCIEYAVNNASYVDGARRFSSDFIMVYSCVGINLSIILKDEYAAPRRWTPFADDDQTLYSTLAMRLHR